MRQHCQGNNKTAKSDTRDPTHHTLLRYLLKLATPNTNTTTLANGIAVLTGETNASAEDTRRDTKKKKKKVSTRPTKVGVHLSFNCFALFSSG